MACGQNLDNKEVRSGGGGCKARPAAGGFSLSGPDWLLTGSIVHRMGEIVGKVGGIFLRGCGWGGDGGAGRGRLDGWWGLELAVTIRRPEGLAAGRLLGLYRLSMSGLATCH